MKLTIIIPVYNEEKTVRNVLKRVFSVKIPCQKEIIVVDDGSTDGTKTALKVFHMTKQIKIIQHSYNLGKGAAIQTGVKAATGDCLLIQDADLEYNPLEIPKLLKPLLSQKANGQRPTANIAVYGSRFLQKKAVIPSLYLLGNKFLTILTNLLYGTKLTDMETGYKLLPAKFIKNIKLESKRFDIEPEITIKLVKNKIPIVEIPISYKGRSHFAGKKLTVKDAFAVLKVLLQHLFVL